MVRERDRLDNDECSNYPSASAGWTNASPARLTAPRSPSLLFIPGEADLAPAQTTLLEELLG